MITIDRRAFLSSLAGSLFAASAEPQYPATLNPPTTGETCWLDVAAPFVIADPALDLSTDILLTATCFPGADGYRESRYATDYQILLFDANGKEIPLDNAGKVEIPALRPKLVRVSDLVGRNAFFGGMKLRVAPSPHQVPRAGDLFSAGFVRWNLPRNFDNVHAHPAAPQQVIGRFNYSMPFPALSEFHCAFALFNPNEEESRGTVRVVD